MFGVKGVLYYVECAPCNHRKFTSCETSRHECPKDRGREGEEVGKKKKETLGAGGSRRGNIGAWMKVVDAAFQHKFGEAAHDRFGLYMKVSAHSIRVPSTEQSNGEIINAST